MPFETDITIDGTNYPASFWVVQNYSANQVNKTGSVLAIGFATMGAYASGASPVPGAQVLAACSHPEIFDQFFSPAESRFGSESLISRLEDFVIAQPGTLITGAVVFYSSIELRAAEIGLSFNVPEIVDEVMVDNFVSGNDRVLVWFSRFGLGSSADPVDYVTGVTIEVNGVAATITDAMMFAMSGVMILIYVLDEPVDANDVVFWFYDGAGFLVDDESRPLMQLGPLRADNTIGEYWDFSTGDSSGQFAIYF